MIHIEKGAEPSALRRHRERVGADGSYAKMRLDVLDPVRRALVADQGYLCAYCMQRITPEPDDRGAPRRGLLRPSLLSLL